MSDKPATRPQYVSPMAIVPGTNPFEVYWLIGLIIIGMVWVFGNPAPSSIEQNLPDWGITLWYASIGIGSAICLTGLKKRRVSLNGDEEGLRKGLVLYACGWAYVGIASIVYGSLILVTFRLTGMASGLATLCWGMAALTKVRQVHRLLRYSRYTGGKHR